MALLTIRRMIGIIMSIRTLALENWSSLTNNNWFFPSFLHVSPLCRSDFTSVNSDQHTIMMEYVRALEQWLQKDLDCLGQGFTCCSSVPPIRSGKKVFYSLASCCLLFSRCSDSQLAHFLIILRGRSPFFLNCSCDHDHTGQSCKKKTVLFIILTNCNYLVFLKRLWK